MYQSKPRYASWWRLATALAVLVAAAGTQSTGQTATGAAAPPRAGQQAPPPAGQAAPLLVLSPKAKSPGWTGVHRPHTRLSDVLARHPVERNDQADWVETIVDDESLFAQWISMGPGRKTPRRMNGDTREWWIVQSGALRFTVEDREPVVATRLRLASPTVSFAPPSAGRAVLPERSSTRAWIRAGQDGQWTGGSAYESVAVRPCGRVAGGPVAGCLRRCTGASSGGQ
jgi:hypothetical protein